MKVFIRLMKEMVEINLVNAFSGLKVSKKIAADYRVSEQAIKWTCLLVGAWPPLKQTEALGRTESCF